MWSEFEAFGLKMAPGLASYTQVARVVRPRLVGQPRLTVAGLSLPSLQLFIGVGDVRGKLAVMTTAYAGQLPANEIVGATNPTASLRALMNAAEFEGREAADRARVGWHAAGPCDDRGHAAAGILCRGSRSAGITGGGDAVT